MNIHDRITAELARAVKKFPTWPTDPLHALAVLGEEFGELTKVMLQHTYEQHKGVTLQDIEEEAIQTAAMAIRLVLSLREYEYQPGTQHTQDVGLFGEVSDGAIYAAASRRAAPEWHAEMDKLLGISDEMKK